MSPGIPRTVHASDDELSDASDGQNSHRSGRLRANVPASQVPPLAWPSVPPPPLPHREPRSSRPTILGMAAASMPETANKRDRQERAPGLDIWAAPEQPPYQREGGPNISDHQLMQILQGTEMARSLRPAREREPLVPGLLRHNFPLSMAPSRSAVVTTEMSRQSAETAVTPMTRIIEAIGLSTQIRLTRREERQQRTGQAERQPTPDSMPGLVESNDTTREASPEPVPVPKIFEGLDEACSICVETFRHGERVCRLSCRHMFHAGCWESALRYTGASGITPRRLNCPNCRGAGTVIAVRPFIDETLVTQRLTSGSQAPKTE